jgi:hypothetical protein
MDQEMARRHLELAEERIKAGEKNIARQREVVAELDRDGHDTTTARDLLATFEELQERHIAHRSDLIRRELGEGSDR